MTRSWLFMCTLTLQLSLVLCDDKNYGVMRVHSSEGWKSHFCLLYNPGFHELPATADHAATYPLVSLTTEQEHGYGCYASDYPPAIVNGTVAIVARSNCTFVTKASLAQAAGAKAIVIASDVLVIPGAGNNTVDYNNINITVGSIRWSDFRLIHKQWHGNRMSALLYNPVASKFDANIALFFFLSIFVIAVGGFWSGKAKYNKVMGHSVNDSDVQATSMSAGTAAGNEAANDNEGKEQDESMDISFKIIIVFLVLACTFLILMYFFYDYLVYVVIVLFALVGAMGLYSCVQPWIWRKLVPWSKRIPENRVPIFRGRPQYRNIILGLLCLGVGIFWFVERHASYAWIIQDFLGVMFCINVLRTITIPNLKICTILLGLLFVYDVFFVFLTPLITKRGDSIMVKVATGGDSKTKEKIPMVFISPRLIPDEANVCLAESVLGFGDAVVPGLLIAHNHAFDLLVGSSKKVYYFATIIAYCVGLAITYAVLAVMETGQPALMYLVPCTLVTTFVIGWLRGEVRLLWKGVKVAKNEPTTETANSGNDAGENPSAVPARTMTDETGSTRSRSTTENENKQLLNHLVT